MNSFEVGDIVRPGNKPKPGSYSSSRYQSLDYSSTYRVTEVYGQGNKQKVSLEPFEKKSSNSRFRYENCFGQIYSSGGMILVKKFGENSSDEPVVNNFQNGKVTTKTEWIVVDGETGSIVASIDAIEIVPLASIEERWENGSIVKSTADALALKSTIRMAEDRTNDIVTELLRSNPRGSYRVYKLNKIGKLPELPVIWERGNNV